VAVSLFVVANPSVVIKGFGASQTFPCLDDALAAQLLLTALKPSMFVPAGA
jgi:hypothetical protein